MKHLVEQIMTIKFNSCMCFTGFLIVNALAQLLVGAKPLSGWAIIGFLLLSLVCGSLQYLFFSPSFIKSLGYFQRSLFFGGTVLVVLIPCAVFFHWFPVNEWSAWAVFLGVFLAVFVVVMVAFEMVFRITGRRYTDLLGEKQNQK